MEHLDNITLCCIDCIDYNRALRALKISSRYIDFPHVKLFTNQLQFHDEFEIVQINNLFSKNSYSEFIINNLIDHIDTEFILIVQWDGFLVNSNAWTNEFLKYDYIGAPWKWDKVVGNGGFSLRSKKLLEICKQIGVKPPEGSQTNEDHLICRVFREELETLNMKFAPYDIAKKFSVENEIYSGSLGWHGGTEPRKFFEWYINR